MIKIKITEMFYILWYFLKSHVFYTYTSVWNCYISCVQRPVATILDSEETLQRLLDQLYVVHVYVCVCVLGRRGKETEDIAVTPRCLVWLAIVINEDSKYKSRNRFG